MMKICSIDELSGKRCVPCEGGVEPSSREFAQEQVGALNGWQLSADGKKISRKWELKNFVAAMKLLQIAADVAEAEQHHPDLHLTGYKYVRIDLTTHAIDGLSENDFIVAAKIDSAAGDVS